MGEVNRVLSVQELDKFLKQERKKQISYLQRHFSISQSDAEDIYQESSIALFLNIKGGKLVKLTSTLSTYFTQICKNQALKMLRNLVYTDTVDNVNYDSDKIEELLGMSNTGLTPNQTAMMHDIVSKLPPPCDEILWAYYGDERSMQEIAQILNYKNADTVKAKKSQCMSKLKERFDKQTKEEFYDHD